MSDSKQMLQRARERFVPPGDVMESLVRRRVKKERNRRVSAAVLAIVIALVSFVALTRAFHGAERPATEPTPTPVDRGIFSEVGGWIAYGDKKGIWAVDPTHPNDPNSQIQLSTERGTPLAWSSDGSKLLCSNRRRGLFVLHADGTETLLIREAVSGASFSPDGTTVVFAPRVQAGYLDPGIYLIDADGGVPRLLLAPGRRYYPEEDRSYGTFPALPTFSPDGTQIAYIDGIGDWGNSLRVMNADGSDVHVLDGSDVHLLGLGKGPAVDLSPHFGLGSVNDLGMHPNGLSWSPDGTRLAVGLLNPGIYVVDADGSGLTLTVVDGRKPYWSPDGTRISYQRNRRRVLGPLWIAAADGTSVVEFGYARSGPWNPAPR